MSVSAKIKTYKLVYNRKDNLSKLSFGMWGSFYCESAVLARTTQNTKAIK